MVAKRDKPDLDEMLNSMGDEMIRRLISEGMGFDKAFASMFGVKHRPDEVRWDIVAYDADAYNRINNVFGSSIPLVQEGLTYGVIIGANASHLAKLIADEKVSMADLRAMDGVYVRFMVRGRTINLPLARAVEVFYPELTAHNISRQ